MGAALGDGFPATGGESERDGFLEFGHIDALFLEIGVLSHHPGGVELGSASSVGVSASNLRTLL